MYFWVIEVLTTGTGATASDMAHRLEPMRAVGLIAVQLYVRRYVAWVYWLAVVMVDVFGAMAADVLHVGFGVPYVISTAGFTIALGAVFIVWHATEKTLSIRVGAEHSAGAQAPDGPPCR